MKRSLLVLTLFLVANVLSYLYVERLKDKVFVEREEIGIAEGVRIRVFGEKALEWLIFGKTLISVGDEVSLSGVLMESSYGYSLRADSVFLNRESKKAKLQGTVDLRGEAFFVRTEEAVADLSKGKVYGKKGVKIWKDRNYVEGKSFEVRLKPFFVRVREVKTKHEM